MEWYYCHRSRVDKEVRVPIRLKLIPHPQEQVTELSLGNDQYIFWKFSKLKNPSC